MLNITEGKLISGLKNERIPVSLATEKPELKDNHSCIFYCKNHQTFK